MNWQKQHLQAIQSSYGKSPYYIYYKDSLNDLFNQKFELLYEFNSASQIWLAEQMNISYSVFETNSYEKILAPGFIDLRNRINKKNLSSFKNQTYYQVQGTMQSEFASLSALDLLFHLGPESLRYIRGFEIEVCIAQLLSNN